MQRRNIPAQDVREHHAVQDSCMSRVWRVQIHIAIEIYHAQLGKMFRQGRQNTDRYRAVSADHQRPCAVGERRFNPTGDLFKDIDYKRNILLFRMLGIGCKRHLGKVTQIRDFMTVGSQKLHQTCVAEALRRLLLAHEARAGTGRSAN